MGEGWDWVLLGRRGSSTTKKNNSQLRKVGSEQREGWQQTTGRFAVNLPMYHMSMSEWDVQTRYWNVPYIHHIGKQCL
jgi:hypothetical protein